MTNEPHRAPEVQAPPAGTSNADKARALIALLEEGGGGPERPEIPASRLRDWARDLVETVERAAVPAPAPEAEPPVARPRAPSPRLFTRAAPVLIDRASPDPVVSPPVARSPTARTFAPRLTLAAPMPQAPPRSRSDTAEPPTFLSRQEVDRLIASIVDPAGDAAGLLREHPAVIAVTLAGKSTLEQAAALRTLPGGQMRAVHRALRQLEKYPAGG